MPNTSNVEDIETHSALARRYQTLTFDLVQNNCVTFSGNATDMVTKEKPCIELYNPTGNVVQFFFTVTDKDTGETIATTNEVYPTEYDAVNIYDFYKTSGKYTASVKVDTMTADGHQGPRREYDTEVIVKKG